MATRRGRRFAPLWLMGLANAVFGMYGGILVISVPQSLSARGVPEATIASMTAVMMSPGFWTFLASPMLDVRFSRRAYSVATALAAAGLLLTALRSMDDLRRVEVLLVAGFFCANLYQSALGGWLASITTAADESRLSVCVTIGNLGGGGLMAVLAGALMHRLPAGAAAGVVAAALLLPLAVVPWMPAPGPDRRLARESFPQFFGEVLGLLKRREILIAIVLFVAPAATFSLTNFIGGLGSEFQASPGFVGLVGGAGVTLGGVTGCLAFRLIDRWLPFRALYLAIGAAGALFTVALMPMAHVPATFAAALIGENVFQALALTAATAIAFETIGRGNPLSATTYSLMLSAFNVPVTYMLFVDAWGYSRYGIAGSLAADAGLSLAACVALGALLVRSAGRPRAAAADAPPPNP